MAQFNALRPLAQRAAEVECALWFHDAIYDVHAHDNEQRSARWASQALVAAGVDADTVARIDAPDPGYTAYGTASAGRPAIAGGH